MGESIMSHYEKAITDLELQLDTIFYAYNEIAALLKYHAIKWEEDDSMVPCWVPSVDTMSEYETISPDAQMFLMVSYKNLESLTIRAGRMYDDWFSDVQGYPDFVDPSFCLTQWTK